MTRLEGQVDFPEEPAVNDEVVFNDGPVAYAHDLVPGKSRGTVYCEADPPDEEPPPPAEALEPAEGHESYRLGELLPLDGNTTFSFRT